MSDTYNGWANYETWNVTLWISSDEHLWRQVRRARDWAHAIEILKDMGLTETGDEVSYTDPALDTDELDAWLAE